MNLDISAPSAAISHSAWFPQSACFLPTRNVNLDVLNIGHEHQVQVRLHHCFRASCILHTHRTRHSLLRRSSTCFYDDLFGCSSLSPPGRSPTSSLRVHLPEHPWQGVRHLKSNGKTRAKHLRFRISRPINSFFAQEAMIIQYVKLHPFLIPP